MELQQLRNFKLVAELENITHAAEKLYMSQPNLSTSLKRLESDLNVPLFNRNRGRISLTPYGKTFLSAVTRSLDELDRGIQDIKREYGNSLGLVRIASPLPDMTADVLKEFSSRNPNVGIRQFNYPNHKCIEALIDGKADIVAMFGPVNDPRIEFVPVGHCQRVLVVSSNHVLAGSSPIPLSRLEKEPCIINVNRGDEYFFQILANLGVKPNIVCKCDNDLVETNLISSGFGVSVSPLLNFVKLKENYPLLQLEMVMFDEPTIPATMGYAYLKDTFLPKSAEILCKILHDFFKNDDEKIAKILKQYNSGKKFY